MAVNFSSSELFVCAGRISDFPSAPLPQAVLSGRSNVGKSTLINTVLGRKSLARVSSSPGKTVTVNFYRVDRAFLLVDLPGYGFARRAAEDRARWSALTEGFFTKNPSADRIKIVLQLIDLEVGPTADDELMFSFLSERGIPFAVVASKADKPNRTARAAALEALAAREDVKPALAIIPFSGTTGEGKEEIRRLILKETGIR